MARFAYLALFLATAASCLAASAPQDLVPPSTPGKKWQWSLCKPDKQYPLLIQDIDVSPDPPLPGEDLTVTVIGKSTGTIEDGAYADVAVKVGRIKLLQKEFDVCEEARNANATVQCPVEEGSYTVTHTVALPKQIPPTAFNVHIEVYDKDDEELSCLDLSINFRKQFW